MKAQLENEIFSMIMPYIKEGHYEDVRMRITMAVGNYEIKKASTEVAVWEGDANEQILKRYLVAKIANGLSPRTIAYYKQTLQYFFNYVNKPYSQVTADDVRFYLVLRVQKDKVSKTTANNEKRNLSAFYKWLQTEEILLKNPMAKIGNMKETKKKKKAFQLEDIERIRLGCRTNMEKAIIEVLASTWCRVSEMANIRIDQIHDGKVVVRGKGDKEREVFLNARAKLAIEGYIKERKDQNPYLFPKCRYSATSSEFKKLPIERKKWWYTVPEMVSDEAMCRDVIEYRVKKIGERAGVDKVHPHRFRRTGATLALRQGMPLIVVSKILGHESVETTQIYLDISDKELEQNHEKYVI